MIEMYEKEAKEIKANEINFFDSSVENLSLIIAKTHTRPEDAPKELINLPQNNSSIDLLSKEYI